MVKQTPEMKPRQSLREVGKFGVAALIGTGAIFFTTQFRMPPDNELIERGLTCEPPAKETVAKFGDTVSEIVDENVKFGSGVTTRDVLDLKIVVGINPSMGGASFYTAENANELSAGTIIKTPSSCHFSYWTKK